MDIQISSNFERLLFDVCGGDGAQVRRAMQGFRQSGEFSVSAEQHRRLRRLFDAQRFDDDQTSAEIARCLEESGELLDPHSAIATAAARGSLRPEISAVVALATAHPAKFPDAVEKATGVRPPLPARLADLYDREERCMTLPNDLVALQEFIRGRRQNPPQRAKGAA
jgi:threonine synthase